MVVVAKGVGNYYRTIDGYLLVYCGTPLYDLSMMNEMDEFGSPLSIFLFMTIMVFISLYASVIFCFFLWMKYVSCRCMLDYLCYLWYYGECLHNP